MEDVPRIRERMLAEILQAGENWENDGIAGVVSGAL